MKPIAYLDHAATTDVRQEVIDTMMDVMAMTGNPSSLHAQGREARKIVEVAREQIAQALECAPGEVVFTSGGTEADNLAIKGIFWKRRKEDPRRIRILASAIEHHAVLDPIQWLVDNEGAVVDWIPVDDVGRIKVAALEALIAQNPDDIALISVMYANNEVGTIQPISEVVVAAAKHHIPVHSDAVQAIGNERISFRSLGLAAMTVSGHKIGGPMGVGALILRRDLDPVPVLHGGGQEREVRSGTIPTPLIAGFGIAVLHAVGEMQLHVQRTALLRDRLLHGVLHTIHDATYNGDVKRRLPGNAHFSFPGCTGDSLLMLFDTAGIAVSTGSACTAGIPQPSHVLLAMGMDPELANGSLRFSFGRMSTPADVDRVLEVIEDAVQRARRVPKPNSQDN